jgi:alkanesulfonate monooxygenase SsuD/methylene tetrahydromethanopterin reductase-like flavin-dependent oxidoreductase (luciferase family)
MKFGLLFSFQTPPGSGIPSHEPYRDMLTALPRAEQLGYASAWVATHHAQPDGLCPSPIAAMAAMAAVTTTMRIGSAILLVPLYAPLKLAEDVAVLDNISNGRIVLGVAPGYVTEEFEAHGVPRSERVGRLEESLDLLQAAWTQDSFSFDGKYYRVPQTIMTPKPVQQPLPVWYGVSAPASLRRAARRGCPVIASPRHTLAELKEHYAVYREEAAAVGLQVTDIPIIREVFVAGTAKKAEELAAPGLTYLFRELYGARSASGERELTTDDGRLVETKDDVSWESIRERFVIGDPDYVVEELKTYQRELGATEMICWMNVPGVRGTEAMSSIELFAKEVMPAFAGGAA